MIRIGYWDVLGYCIVTKNEEQYGQFFRLL